MTGKIVTTDYRSDAPAAFVADIHERVPPIHAEDYLERLKTICQQHHIQLIVPLIDPELYLLSVHKQDLEAIGAMPLVCSAQTNAICIDKRKTGAFLASIGVQTPKILTATDLTDGANLEFPLLVKPADGSSSVGVTIINNWKELMFFKDYIPNAIVQEFVQGQEYTLDILVNLQGQVCSVVPRLRMATRAGEISKGMTVKYPQIIAEGEKIVNALPGALGCVTVQCFLQPDRQLKFIEINPRFGGGIPLSIQAGAHFPRWIIEMMMGRCPDMGLDRWQEGIVMLRYDDAIFTTVDRL